VSLFRERCKVYNAFQRSYFKKHLRTEVHENLGHQPGPRVEVWIGSLVDMLGYMVTSQHVFSPYG
jgi:hypothetical protein